MKKFIILGSSLLLCNCASIASGTTQTLNINTNPAGADCAFTRDGKLIGRVNPTPGAIKVDRTKYDIIVECSKSGYQTATYTNKSGGEGTVAGNILLGGGIGWAIDSATGADNEYEEIMNINLTR